MAAVKQQTNDAEPLTKLEQFTLAALAGVCSSPNEKYDNCNDLQTARKAISIARHVLRELESEQA